MLRTLNLVLLDPGGPSQFGSNYYRFGPSQSKKLVSYNWDPTVDRFIPSRSIHIKVLGTIRFEEINKSEHACMKISHRASRSLAQTSTTGPSSLLVAAPGHRLGAAHGLHSTIFLENRLS